MLCRTLSPVVILAFTSIGSLASLPKFTKQPVDQTIVPPAAATFSVLATGRPTPAYWWQVSKDGGKSWIDAVGGSGQGTTRYATGPTTAAYNGWRYRAIAENSAGYIVSREAVLSAGSGAGQSEKARIIKYLKDVGNSSERKVLSGQNSGHLWDIVSNNNYYISALGAKTGQYPAVMSVDYGMFTHIWDEKNPEIDDLSSVRKYIEEQWRSGGLVSLSFHPGNPQTGGDAWDKDFDQFYELIEPGTAVNLKWMKLLKTVADELEVLKSKGIVVLWRPLHEMNGNWFWWGPYHEASSDAPAQWHDSTAYTNMWKHMYNYFTKERKLDNLIWVYSPNACDHRALDAGLMKDATYFYPGNDYVDVVGLDWYTDQPKATDQPGSLNDCGGYDDLLALNKPFGITEFGPLKKTDGSVNTLDLLDALKTNYTHVSYFVYWHSFGDVKTAIVDCQNASAMMNSPMVVNRGHLAW